MGRVAKVYARNKEALDKARASRELPMGTLNPNQSPSTGAAPATIALHRTPRDKATLLLRERVVKQEGEFGPGIRVSHNATAPQAAAKKPTDERAEDMIQNRAATPAPLDAIAKGFTRAQVGRGGSLARIPSVVATNAAPVPAYLPERAS